MLEVGEEVRSGKLPLVHLIRDPLEICISGYLYHLGSTEPCVPRLHMIYTGCRTFGGATRTPSRHTPPGRTADASQAQPRPSLEPPPNPQDTHSVHLV